MCLYLLPFFGGKGAARDLEGQELTLLEERTASSVGVLYEPAAELLETADTPALEKGMPAASRSRPSWIVGLGGLLLGLAAGAALYSVFSSEQPQNSLTARSTRRSILLSEPLGGPRHVLGVAISNDGKAVALGQGYGLDGQLELRHLDTLESVGVPGTEGAVAPFFSPDGEWVAFFDDDELRKIPVSGGPSSVICEARTAFGGTWSDDGWIYFTHGESRLARVPEEGGNPEELSKEIIFGPHALPGGRGIVANLSQALTSSLRKDEAAIALITPQGETRTLIEGGYAPKYVPSGHLVFIRQGALFAAPFDLDRLEVTGSGVQVPPRVSVDSVWARALYDVADDGTLIYLQGGDYAATVPTWIARDGAEQPLSMPLNTYSTFQLSPDGSRLAIQVSEAQDQIHIYDFARGTSTRLTFEGPSRYPVWTRDGTEVIYHAVRNGGTTLRRRRVDGSAEEVPVLTDEHRNLMGDLFIFPYSVSPDGRHLLVGTFGDLEMGADIWLLALDGESEPRPLMQTSDNEIIPMFSPTGEYILYHSNKAGPYGIYVRPFPDMERREWTIAAHGGYDARWSPAGDEIVYRYGATGFKSVPYSLDPEFTPGSERLVLESDSHDSSGFSFDMSADGDRILVNKPTESMLDEKPVILVTDWFTELEQLVPAPR